MKKTFLVWILLIFFWQILFFLLIPFVYARCLGVRLISPTLTNNYILFEEKRPTLSWEPVAGATEYGIQLTSNERYSHDDSYWPVSSDGDVYYFETTSTSFQVPFDLEYGKVYYWHVREAIQEGPIGQWCDFGPIGAFKIYFQPFVELKSPADGERIVNLRPSLCWAPHAPYPADYLPNIPNRLQVATEPSFTHIIIDEILECPYSTSGFITYCFSERELEPNKTYYWRVRIERGVSTTNPLYAHPKMVFPTAWSQVRSFSVILPNPPKTILISPQDNEMVSSPTSFSWYAVPYATEYRLEISDHTDFSNVLLRLFPTTNSITTPLPSRLTDGIYYWRVQAKNSQGYGEWSEPRSFKKISSIRAPVLHTPRDEEKIHTLAPEFSWGLGDERDAPSTYYAHLQISHNRNFSTLIFDKDDIEIKDRRHRYLLPVDLVREGGIFDRTSAIDFFWRIRWKNAGIWSPWSDVHKFTVIFPVSIAKAELTSPENGSTVSTSQIQFSFRRTNCSGICTGGGYYRLQISDTLNFDKILIESSSFIISTEKLENKTYYWRVKIRDDLGWGPWSEVWSFVFQNPLRGVSLKLENPKSGVRGTTRPEFIWSILSRDFVQSGDKCHLQVSFNPDMSSPFLIDNPDLAANYEWDVRFRGGKYTMSYTPSFDLPSGYNYYWRVRQTRNGLWSPWTDTESFWIVSSSTIPVTLEPANNTFLRTTRPRFSWRRIGNEKEIEISDHQDFSNVIFSQRIPESDVDSYLLPQDLREGFISGAYAQI